MNSGKLILVRHGLSVYNDQNRSFTLPEPSLSGSHQIINMGLSVAGVSYLNLCKDQETLRRALLSVEWPGRCQKISGGPICDLLNDNWELWLDGGHNLDAAKALMEKKGLGAILIPARGAPGMMGMAQYFTNPNLWAGPAWVVLTADDPEQALLIWA